MESEYDRKFQEMKMYIPFLEEMIQKLESSSPAAMNPRQAQLNKIRSLRGLLLDKKKRMKMENLLKCEQVLVNLYAKVELQRDGCTETKPSLEKKEVRKENSDLETVRNKLKSVVQMQEAEDTLPEIARASEIEEVCTPGSKEPALFQRRPNKSSLSPPRATNISQDNITTPATSSRPVPLSSTKRNYTRVLLSPEPSVRRRPPSECPPDPPLYSRRSPRRSPKRNSLTYHKKERKKSSKESKQKSKNLNITLNVPQESLESLNTSDILSRIINCRDDDVEIDTLRELRSQILGELKQTGSNEDISDLILKSYEKENTKSKPKDVEEGELSDSESEAIENIYGSLPVTDKIQSKQKASKGDKRKIQICLVINSDKDDDSKKATIKPIDNFDLTQDDACTEDESTKTNVISLDSDEASSPTKHHGAIKNSKLNQVNLIKPSTSADNKPTKPLVITIDDDEKVTKRLAKPSGNDDPIIINENTSTKPTESTLSKPTELTLTKPSELTSQPTEATSSKPTESTSTKSTESTSTKSTESTSSKSTESTSSKPTSSSTKPSKSLEELAASIKKTSPVKMNEVGVKSPPKNSSQSDGFDFLPTLKQLEQSDRLAEETTKTKFVANFYKPINPNDDEKEKTTSVDKNVEIDIVVDKPSKPKTYAPVAETLASVDTPAEPQTSAVVREIPLLHEPATVVPAPEKTPKNVSEIDILQALKNEILSETLPIATSEAGTPALHQPKITKVSSAKEILPKKRISIEKYKQKSVTSSKSKRLFISQRINDLRDKKQSIKLTEKECERFKLPVRLSLDEDDISDDALSLDGTITADDIYNDLAPKSPDNEIFSDSGNSTPVIIPTDPIKTVVTSSVADVDMRAIIPPQPVPSPTIMPLPAPPFPPLLNPDVPSIEPIINRVIADPRIRKDLAQPKASPKQYGVNPEGTPRPVQFPNIPPLLTPSYTPSYTPSTPLLMIPNARSFEMTPSRQPFEMTPSRQPFEMTPSRQAFEMTPSRQTFELDEPSNKKHVYAPTFSPFDREASVPRTFSNHDEDRRSQRDERPWDDRNSRGTSVQSDSHRYDKQDQRHEKYQDSRHDKYSDRKRDRYHDQRFDKYQDQRYDNKYDKYQNQRRDSYHPEQRNDKFHVDRREYSAPDCPTTPIPSFGWSESPGTPRRQDPPMTPSHPFGRSECPTTPSHPFGRSEGPTTPSHPFGRSECQTTPSHPFGRSECPTTPSHPFGRSDARSEQQKSTNATFRKDPRLNRRTDSEPLPDFTKRERGFLPDHRYGSGSNYNPNYDKDGHKSRFYDRGKQEPSVGRSISRDSEGDNRFFSKNPDNRDNRSSTSHEEPWSRRNYRENSVGRSMYADNSRNLRATSTGRNTGTYENRETDNRMSIKSKSGRSFTIDTSVNSSFCKLIESGKGIKVFDYSFTDRRQRAASVGRSLVRENSVGRQINTVVINREYSNDRMKRASSVGRDLLKSDKNKSLRDLKAEFQSFRDRITLKIPTSGEKQKTPSHSSNTKVKENPYKTDYRSRKDDYNQYGRKTNDSSKQLYSPRSNYRDPRMRREQRDYQNKSRSGSDSRDRRQYGIVYSNDNLAKGTIISPGFGVKNYKIPKIKRPDPEPEPQPEIVPTKVPVKEKEVKPKLTIEKLSEKGSQKTQKPVKKEQTVSKTEKLLKKDQEKKSIGKHTNETYKINENAEEEKRVTRSSKKSDSIAPLKLEDGTPKERKTKRRVISDSESEPDQPTVINESKLTKTDSPRRAKPKSKLEAVITSSNSEESAKNKDSVLDSSFGMDDLSLFSENIVNDPVIDNINALIADLDQDLDAKSVSPTDIENIMESMHDPEENILGDISEVIENDLNESKKLKDSSETAENFDKKFDALKNASTEQSAEKDLSQINNENIVSTTDTSFDNLKSSVDTKYVTTNKDDNIDQSIPDSTINKIETTLKPGQGSPDSTNESNNQSNTIVTSTHDNESDNKESSEPSSSRKEVDSLDSLLSILQNKAKLKELLSRLDDTSSESDKIKKKLEKLSAIVSDDEDSNEKVDAESVKKDTQALTSLNEDNSVARKGNESEKNDLHVENEMNVNQCKEIDKTEDIHTSPRESPKVGAKTVESQIKNLESTNKITDVEIDKKGVNVHATLSDKPSADTKVEETELPLKTDSSLEKDSEVKGKTEREAESKETTDNEMNNQELDDMAAPKAGRKKRRRVRRRGKKMTGRKVEAVTAPPAATDQQTKKVTSRKTRNRELKSLQDDINEMSIRDDILNATGIRMCRLTKIGEDKSENANEESVIQDSGPVVVLEKFNVDNMTDAEDIPVKIRKKTGPKPKPKKDNVSIEKIDKSSSNIDKPKPKNKPGPKSKQKRENSDPYEFDMESVADTNTTNDSDDDDSTSDDQSLASSRSFGSSEILADIKKKVRRKRGAWQTGVIKPRNRKKKEQKPDVDVDEKLTPKPITIPDYNCFTDKTYCFKKNTTTYACRLCYYSGDDIVKHYRKEHPHTEIPLSRIEKGEARIAIEQCEEINFQAISKLASDKYTCRFCYKEFNFRKQVLETFFWHIVSAHTGEYKQACYSCVTETRCPFNLDIPPPPKELQKQLIGYICGKCNFTQISLENLKTHVIVRHNDEQTEVYTINLSALSRRAITTMLRRSKATKEPRMLRSTRSNQSNTEASDDTSIVTGSELTEDRPLSPILGENYVSPFKSKIFFENDDQSLTSVKLENDDVDVTNFEDSFADHPDTEEPLDETASSSRFTTDEIVDCAHFRLYITESGTKEYVCCINDNMHYKTPLLISIKKHVQIKHDDESWDGYCTLCKVIVTPQGVKSTYKDCLTHYLSKHSDDFPVAETLKAPLVEKPIERPATPVEKPPTPKPYLAIRPLAELIAKELTGDKPAPAQEIVLPVIDNVVSLEQSPAPTPTPPPVTTTPVTYPAASVTPTYPTVEETSTPKQPFEYEEVQADVMSKKYRIVLDAMMTKEALIRVFKCAGRFCSFTTDSTEDALLHASTHQRVGGEDALRCAYCNFDASGNAIDLVMHVFKEHSRCQFACGQCFYRAIASRLVGAHFAKVHANSGKPLSILRNATAPAQPVESNKDLLTREQAVPFYVCQYGEGSCKYRSYIPGKFVEHVDLKHASADVHPCYLCDANLSSTSELIEHMKTHGLRLYQCTWCVHGASNESELITHVATKHPGQLPQAYLRIITNKEGSKDLRVLPLAYLNKSPVNAEDVTPSNVRENPVKEAERSIDLEKLIGDTNMLVNSISATENEVSEAPVQTVIPIETTEVTKSVTPPPPSVVKIEPTETTSIEIPSDVICLDSDDETEVTKKTPQKAPEPEPAPDSAPNYRKIPEGLLLKCPFCTLATYKTKIGLTKHTKSCKYKTSEIIICPHSPCTEVLDDLTALFKHYELDHCMARKHISMCQICNERFSQHHIVKLHLKEVHGVTKFRLSAKVQLDGTCLYTFGEQKDELSQQYQPLYKGDQSKGVKRKPSTDRRSSIEPAKRFAADTPKKYGINDIDKLPINPILDSPVFCDLCGYNTKVRLNMIRHLQLHAENQSVPSSEPVNPVPHLETNEKHFDKMVNLASSSVVTRAPEKTKDKDVSVLIPVQDASQYPQYVSERQRLTCGARGCSYISVDEGMLRCHWDTLHAGTTDYHCVHCPPYQHLDTSKPLTASHIIAHLKMHDVALYACSNCLYYHYKRQAVEKHLSEHHRGGQVKVVREEAPTTPTQSTIAPTMDLKPYQCGLCQFKSLLRQEVGEHCAKIHQSKMQFKCGYCPFRTSAIENVTKHQTNSHPGKPEDIFYYYYKEGSIPDEDGVPKWRKQVQKMAPTEVKREPEVDPSTSTAPQTPTRSLLRYPTVTVDLNIVKQEVDEDNPDIPISIEDLCKKYGEFCPPNGIKYRCCLCNVAMEHTRENMRSHLFEELNYRRWSCGVCPYKAFHQTGLNEHMSQEHSRQIVEPTQLPIDHSIEKWVTAFLDHQTSIIDKNKAEFAKQKIVIEKPVPVVTKIVESPKPSNVNSNLNLEQAFGDFGAPINDLYSCPKCNYKAKEETDMRNHLESELTKIRWCCSNCTLKFQTYHEAQFHCKSVHTGQPTRPIEAIRDPAVRSSWVTAVIASQKQRKKATEVKTTPEKADNEENSLLKVRYAETANLDEQGLVTRKRPSDSDDDFEPKRQNERQCPYCTYKHKYPATIKEHILKHYNLKPFTCGHCDFDNTRKLVLLHMESVHPNLSRRVRPTKIPDVLPTAYNQKLQQPQTAWQTKICLTCEKSLGPKEINHHLHGTEKPEFGISGDTVLICGFCHKLISSLTVLKEHQQKLHPNKQLHYVKLPLKDVYKLTCLYCDNKFKQISHFATHHTAIHPNLRMNFTHDDGEGATNSALETSRKCVARKSTTKLPNQTVAKKSTTKLPMIYYEGDSEEEYSFYGTKPLPFDSYKHVTTQMPMFNTMVDIDVKKFSGLLNIDPRVVVHDINNK